MATILVTHGVPSEGFSLLQGHTVIIPAPLTSFTDEQLAAYMPMADAIVAGGRLTGDLIRKGRKLKIIANYGAGYDSVDIQTAAECGVPVTNLPDAVAESTAELAFGLMLAVSRKIGESTIRMHSEAPEGQFGMGRNMGRNLCGQTLGILGCGKIGQRLAEMASAFGMHVVGFSRHGVHHPCIESVTREELLTCSDIVSLHCPLTDDTRGMVGREALFAMKRGAILINTARGGLVDEEALAEAIRCGQLSGAGLDVYPDEPHVPECLRALTNVVMTPHIGANTEEVRRRMAEECARQIQDALAGRQPEHVVNGISTPISL